MLIAVNKPFNVLCQFTDSAGRLDYNSEGLLLLTDEGSLQQRIADSRNRVFA